MTLSLTHAQSETQFNGNLNLGYWSVTQNTLDQDNAIQTDGVGQDYLQDRYRLLMLNVRLYQQKSSFDSKQTNFRFVGKSRFNLDQTNYTLAYNQKNRYDITELSLEYKNFFSGHDLWLGRQIVFQSGGMRFDGARLILNLNNEGQLGFFSGLGQDPRTSLGFIGSNQNNQFISTDFISLGSYYQHKNDTLNFSSSLNTLLYQGQVDRLYNFTHGTYIPNSKVTLSALLNYSFVPKSLDQLLLNFYYIFSDHLNNSLSFTRWSNIEYAASLSSQIPGQGQFTPDTYVNGDVFNDTYYTQIRDQISYSFLKSQNIFTGIELTKRSFDALNRSRYFLGYKNNALFQPSIDFRTQINFINNYKSAHVAFDFLLGKDFSDGQLRLESFFNRVKTERDVYLNNTLTSLPTENEQEYSFGGNLFWYFSKKNLLHARYQIFKEEDSLNENDKITVNDLYLGTNFKF
ncbi:MAG TPA: hypothetical protein PKB05_01455 [Oligoflexia bacterium]|nr:hypothetical protein [Oligoflexia bacterium]